MAKTIQVQIDIVQGKGSASVTKKILSEQERFAKEMNKRLLNDAKKLADDEVRVEKGKANEKKAIANKFLRSLESESKTAARKMKGIFSDVFAGTFLGMTASTAVTAGLSKAFAGLSTAFQKSLDFSQMKVSLAQFEGSMAAAEARIKTLLKAAADTPGLSFLSAVEGQKRLMAIGFAGDQATKILTGLSRVRVLSGSTKEDFDAMIVNLVQIASGGQKVTQEIREMATRMPAIVKIITDEFGGIDDRLNDIDPKEFINRLANAASKVKADFNSTSLAVENLQDSFDRLYIAIGSVIEQNPEVLAAIRTFTREIDTNADALSNNESQVRSTFGSWVSWTARASISTANFVDGLTTGISAAMSVIAGVITTNIGLVQGAMYAFGSMINKMLIEPLNAVKNLVAQIPMAGGAVAAMIPDIPAIPTEYWRQSANSTLFQGGKLFQSARNDLGSVGNRMNARRESYEDELRMIQFENFKRQGRGTRASSKETFAGGGRDVKGASSGPGRMPKTKSSKVNLNLKDEMTDALEIAAKYGLTVTSGKDGKHNAGSEHYTGGAFDIRSNGVHPGVLEAAMRELRAAGFAVKDERTRPVGQKVWSAPHLHVGGGRSKFRTQIKDEQQLARIKDEWMPKDRYGAEVINSSELVNDQIEGRTEEVKQNDLLAAAYLEVADALFELNENTREEIFLRDLKLGKYGNVTEVEARQLQNYNRMLDLAEKKKKADEDSYNELERIQNLENDRIQRLGEDQERFFEDTKRGWEDLLTDLSRGDFKSIFRRMKEQLLQSFIQPASAYLAQLFGGVPGMQTSGGFGSGGGFGGTPSFGGGSGIGGFFQSLFGGRPQGQAQQSNIQIPAGALGTGAGGGSMWGGFENIKQMGQGLGGMFGGGGKGLGGMLRGMGGGSMMAGIGAAGGAAATMIGSAIGGKWGNVLSLGGMGASIGANFGPWGALIGAGIGAGAGLISMLFNRDDSMKKLKQAAASEFGISVKDKDILKQLKSIGEQYFGKGQAGKNATSVVRTEEGMNILRAYAESSGQSGLKIDRMNFSDENWEGNQYRGRFGGFRAMGGPVSAGMSYVVGERRPELFTPNVSGHISPTTGDPQMMQRVMAVMAQLEETNHILATKLQAVSAGQVLSMGVKENPYAVAHGQNTAMELNPRGAEGLQRSQGIY